MRTRSLHRGAIGKGSFVVSIIFIILFMTATITSVLALTTGQIAQGAAYDAAIIQLLTGLAGLGVGIFLAMMGVVVIKKEETPEDMWSWNKGWIVWGIIGFTLARFINTVAQTAYMPTVLSLSWDETLNIILVAAVFEEALFALGFSTLLYIGLKQALEYRLVSQFGRDLAAWIIILICSLVVSFIFMQFHIGAGYTAAQLQYTFIARFVYTLVYLRSRNVMSSVFAHMANNWLLLVLGI